MFMKYTACLSQSTASRARGMSLSSPSTTATPPPANPVTDAMACDRGGAIAMQRFAPGSGAIAMQRFAPGKGTHALALARLGFLVHPLENGSKKPHLKGYKRL